MPTRTTTRTPTPTIAAVFSLAAAALLAACSPQNNTGARLASGPDRDVPLETLAPRAGSPAASLPPPMPSPDAAPADTTNADTTNADTTKVSHAADLDRSSWPITRFEVPSALPVHQPRYTASVRLNTSQARGKGLFPTANSALDAATFRTNVDQAKEALVAPFAAALDVALFPVRAVVARPWQRSVAGLSPYERAPKERVLPPLPPDPQPAPTPTQPSPADPLYDPARASPPPAPGADPDPQP
jgi:hypothetical protein